MGRYADETVGSDSSPERILLLMQAGRDRELLEDWLNSLARYDIRTRDPGESLSVVGEYDLCVLDRTALARSGVELLSHKEAADPVFRPCLLMIPSDRTETEVLSSLDGPDDAESLIDDTVSLPVDQSVLHRRIENLLSARRSSLRLQERQQQYEELVNLTPEAIFILRDHEILYSNAAAIEVFTGTGGDQTGGDRTSGDGNALEGRSIMTLVTEDGRSDLDACLDEIEQEGGTETFRDLTMQTVTGASIQAEIAGARITFGDASATQLLVRDVTEAYERREQLTLFGRAIQTAVQGVTIADAQQADEPLIYANAAFEEITGYSTAEVLGRNCRFLQGERTDQGTVSRIREAIAARNPVRVEILNYRKDGTPFWNKLDIVPVHDEDGDVTHFLGLQRDVTGRKGREERLQVLDRVLRHNLRNHMNVIMGAAEQLQGADDIKEMVDVAETIRQTAQELLDISEQVHEFTTLIEEGDSELESADIVSMLERVIEGFQSEHPDTSVKLAAPDTAMVVAHPLLPAGLKELFTLTVGDSTTAPPPDIAVTVSSTQEDTVVEVSYQGDVISESDLGVLEKEMETPTHHPQGLEPWLVRWAVLSSDGEVSVSQNGGVEITLRLRRPQNTA
jgi:PAS domain S-box-containing protein